MTADNTPAKAKPRTPSTAETVARVKRLLDFRLKRLEAAMKEIEADVAAIPSEQAERAMDTIVRTLDKIFSMERRNRDHKRAGTAKRKRMSTERIAELARRIERFAAGNGSQGRS